MTRHVVVTGGAGLIGSHLVESLTSDGHPVLAIDDLSGGSADNLALDDAAVDLAEIEIGSVLAAPVVDRAVASASIVFHLASPIGVGRAHDHPEHTAAAIARSTAQVVGACRRHRTPLVFTSSSEVYGPVTGSAPLAEGDLVPFGPEPRWSYGRAKLAAEAQVATLGDDAIDCWIARLFNVVGPRQRPGTGLVVAAFCAAAVRGEPLVVHDDGRPVRSFLHVTDAVRGLRLIAASAELRSRPVNLGGNERVPIGDLATLIAQRSGTDPPIHTVSSTREFGADFAPVEHRVPDLHRLRSHVDFGPERSLVDAVDQCLGWLTPVGTSSS